MKRTLLLGGLAAVTLPLLAFAGGRGFHHGPPASAAEAREHVGERIERALERVDATDAQRAAVDAVLDRDVPKMFALHEDGASLREEGRALFGAAAIDRDAVEDLRRDTVALFDEGSKIMFATMADVAAALTPEQRADIVDAMERMHGPHGRPHGPPPGQR